MSEESQFIGSFAFFVLSIIVYNVELWSLKTQIVGIQEHTFQIVMGPDGGFFVAIDER